MRLEELVPGAVVRGLVHSGLATVTACKWYGDAVVDLTYRNADGNVASALLYRDDEARLQPVTQGRPWAFDGDGATFRLVSEAHRIRLAHLFDPLLAVHTSLVDPLPHQLTAVYERMLPVQPLRFLLADDPGAGKTIMAGLLIKELIARADVKRCLVVCPGSLAEQWQDEMRDKFHLPFEIVTNDNLESAGTGNWFIEHDLVIARLDKLSRNPDVQAKLRMPGAGWDLVVFDEAHKLSASVFGGEVKYTKRYHLAELLGGLTRHLLLMTATPHNGKDQDFQLFLRLLDSDRFEGAFRDGLRIADADDLMRRVVKEQLLTFEGKPLFPERRAYTVTYDLSDRGAELYAQVTKYVREEFDRAEALRQDRRSGTVGFALTILQRRLASSPEAIYQSLRRRKERLEARLREEQVVQRGGGARIAGIGPEMDDDDIDDLEDAPGDEFEARSGQIADEASAARTIEELRQEIATLRNLEKLASEVRRDGDDRKWHELRSVLEQVFTAEGVARQVAEGRTAYADLLPPTSSPHQKLVIFTEHRDTLTYLERQIRTLLGRPEAIRCIHGGMGREERLKAQDAFKFDPSVQILIATDAAGEGINLQRAHLMVNYDLPWNPNRLEQRFGRIHRIGQREVCHLWNLVAGETREGDVYRRLLEKLEEARQALGGQVFDVLGKLEFEDGTTVRPLRDLLLEAIRYGDRPDVRARLTIVVENGVDVERLRSLVQRRAISEDALDVGVIHRLREDMARAELRRLQPHYIGDFFLEAFARLGGRARKREPGRYQVTHVPQAIRARDRAIGAGQTVQSQYERIAFDKACLTGDGLVPAAFVCPGNGLLDATIDLVIEQHRDLLRQGTVLIDNRDDGTEVRVLVALEHSVEDGTTTPSGGSREVSRRLLYVELTRDGTAFALPYAPYLDYRALKADDPSIETILADDACSWIDRTIEDRAMFHAISTVVPGHLEEVRTRRHHQVGRSRVAVHERLTREITYWDHRAAQLLEGERAGKPNARLNSQDATRRAGDLQARMAARMEELDRQQRITARPPVIRGGVVVVPAGLLRRLRGEPAHAPSMPVETQVNAARARLAVMNAERALGYEPVDREFERLGYDIESTDPASGNVRFIEVKGRVAGADSIVVTRNEILYALNSPETFILAIVEIAPDGDTVRYVRKPFRSEPDFGATTVTYDMGELLARSAPPG